MKIKQITHSGEPSTNTNFAVHKNENQIGDTALRLITCMSYLHLNTPVGMRSAVCLFNIPPKHQSIQGWSF